MPEGPSLILFREELSQFKGKKVLETTGSTRIEKERMKGKKILDLKTWGKHLLIVFPGFTIRLHFLMFGVYYIDSTKDRVPRLTLKFKGREINFYNTGVKMIEEPLDSVYDWSADILHEDWNARKALKKLRAMPNKMATDALLDQEVFSGVGNIIKNEVLFRIRVQPASQVGALSDAKLREMIKEARNYSKEFLAWKREGVLKKNWKVHTKKVCPRDGQPLKKEYLGALKRRSFFCASCQKLYKF
jgi:endonuclease-8